MINIEHSYSLLHKVNREQPELADTQSIIQHWHGQRIRRIDRYIQLCVAGGLACAENRNLPSDTGVYLATRCGAVSTSAQVMHTIEAAGELPKPLHFVNTLGNSAGFYLTQLLQLTGTALVLSKETLSFEAALQHAILDLNVGRSEYALVGAFDELALPLEKQLTRLEANPNAQAMFEGSHWLLLSKRHDADRLSAPTYAPSIAELLRPERSGAKPPTPNIQLSFVPTEAERQQLEGCEFDVFREEELSQGTVPHGAFSAASIVAASERLAPCLHISRGYGSNGNSSYCAVSLNNSQAPL